jgi:hypothetical protein
MALSFPALDKRITRDTQALHDFLWQGQKDDQGKLASALLKDAREADAFLRLGGRLHRNAKPLAAGLQTQGTGESLFELLSHSWALGAGTVLAAKGDYRLAATRAKDAISSASIGVCANAGCFEFVEEWEAHKIDFEAYTKKLADFLEPKGVLYAGVFKRTLDTVHDLGLNWNAAATKSEQSLAARASIQVAAWGLLTSVSIRELLGAPPKFPTGDFADIVERIARRA